MLALTEIVKVKLLLPRFPPPPLLPLRDHQYQGDQPLSLVTQHRKTTPVPTLHPQSLSTLDHHRRDLVFPGWIRQHAYIRLRGGSPDGDVASKQGGREEASQVALRFGSEFLILDLAQGFGTEAVHRRLVRLEIPFLTDLHETLLNLVFSPAFSCPPPPPPPPIPFEGTGEVFSTEYIPRRVAQ